MALESIHQELVESTTKHDSIKNKWWIADCFFRKTKHSFF